MDGRTAYGHYCGAVGYTTYDDRPIPKWEDLGERQQAGYNAIASASNAAARECVEALGGDSDCVTELETLKERVDRLWAAHNANIESIRKVLFGDDRDDGQPNAIEAHAGAIEDLRAQVGRLPKLEYVNDLNRQITALRQAHNDHVAATSYNELVKAASVADLSFAPKQDAGLPTVVESAKYARDVASRDERIAELESALDAARDDNAELRSRITRATDSLEPPF